MKAGWKTVKLGDACTFVSRGVSPKYVEDKGILVLNQKCVRNHRVLFDLARRHDNLTKPLIDERLVRAGDVLVNSTGTGTLGRVAQVTEDPSEHATVDSHVSIVRPRKELFHLAYFGYAMILIEPLISEAGKGSGGQTELSREDLRNNFEIPLPPLAEQKRIVALLDEAFAGIDEAKAKAEANLDNAIGLFEMVREDSMREPEEQTISYGFDDICKVDGVLVDPREGANAEKLHVGGANIESKTGRLMALQTARQEGLKSGKFPFQEGMVLYSKIRPNLRKVARPDFDGLCSADMYPLAPVDGCVCRDYLYHLLLTERFTRFAMLGSERAGMPKVNRDYLSRFTTKLPSISEQQALASKLDSLDQSLRLLRELLTKKSAALHELKSSVLSQAFAGELTA